MSERKHTWAASEVRHGYDQIIRDENNNPICSVFLAGWDKKSAASHARLIASAPKLLAALEEFIRLYDESELLASDGGELVAAVHDARAAIAESTGD